MSNYNINLPNFTGRNVPINEIASATGKDPGQPHENKIKIC
ncbi:MAG: hypothetical protein U0M12_06640 [Acutalibacteraceae bacterium]|nr:hypothetical protein [Acutalibacteraceae bacterium]